VKILEQTRELLVLRFGDALLPVFLAAGSFILGLGALVTGSTLRDLPVAAVGLLLLGLGVFWLLRERHVTLTIDRTARTLHIRRWRNLMPGEVIYRLSEIASYEVITSEQQSALDHALAALRLKRSTRSMLVANFPTGPDIILVRDLTAADAAEAKRLILMYVE